MVKRIVTKRKNKDLTVEEFWDYREKFKTTQAVVAPHMFVEEEAVMNRHRYRRHKDLVSTFDPLEGLGEEVPEPFKTHTFDLMDKIQTMPKQLTGFRSKCLTLPLIEVNIQDIFDILFKNLELGDSWEFMLTVMRDTKDLSYPQILARLESMMFQVEQGFTEKVFRRIFRTLSVFYETSIKSIQENIHQVWETFSKVLFSHPNKYIRKFSASSFRYILDRLEPEQYNNFVSSFLEKDLDDFEAEALSESLFSQLKFFKGFLTQESIKRLETMWGILSNQVISHMIIKVINRMPTESNDHSFVFDLDDLTLLVVTKFQDNPECAIHYFLTLFAKHPSTKSSKKTKQHLNNLMRALFDNPDKPEIFTELLVEVILMNNEINDLEYNHLKQVTLAQRVRLLNVIRKEKPQLPAKFLMTLVALFTLEVKQFMKDGGCVLEVYLLLLVLEQSGFKEKLSLPIAPMQIKAMNQEGMGYERVLVLLKLLRIVKVEGNEEVLREQLNQLNSTLSARMVVFCNEQFPLGVFISFGQQFPVLRLTTIMKKEISKLTHSHHLQLSEPPSAVTDSLLAKFKSTRLILLRNKVRKLRHQVLQMFESEINPELYEALRTVDSENIDVNNEREIKQIFLRLRQKARQRVEVEVLVNWGIGFAFTGFNEITESFTEFFGRFLEAHIEDAKSHLMEFFELMNFKMSRTFKEKINSFVERSGDEGICVVKVEGFAEMLEGDYPVQKNEAMEKVGYERMTKTLQKFPRIKGKMATELNQLLGRYFTEEFYRDQNSIKAYKEHPTPQQLPLKQPGPHPLHLSVMLNLVSSTYLPPYECLHYSQQLCPILQSKSLKTQPWEKQWHKSNKVVENASTLFNLPRQQHRIYLHFLWRLVLASNETDRDRIFDHLDQTDLDLEYLLGIHYGELYLDAETIQALSSEQLISHLSLLQDSKLLAFQQRTKSFIKSMKARITSSLPTLTKLIVEIINLGEDSTLSTTANYKPTNKESIKVLLLIFESYHTESIETITREIFTSFRGKIESLSTFVISGIPGVLRLIEILSTQPHLSHLFSEDIITPLSLCYNNTTIYPDSLHALNTIFLNLLESESIPSAIQSNPQTIMDHLFTHISSKHLLEQEIKITKYLSQLVMTVPPKYIQLFVNEILFTLKTKKKSNVTKQRRSSLLDTLFSLSSKSTESQLFKNLIYYIPELEPDQQKQLRDIISNSFQSSIIPKIISDVTATKTKGLVTEPDYDRVFEGLNRLKEVMGELNIDEKEFIVFSILNLGKNTELSVINSFVEIMKVFMAGLGEKNEEEFVLLRKVVKAVLSLLLTSSKNPDTFRVYIRVIQEILTSIKSHSIDIGEINKQVLDLIDTDPQQNFFKLIGYLSHSKKLSGLHKLKKKLLTWVLPQQRLTFPNLITSLLLPILEHMIYRKDSTGNMSSNLYKESIEAYGLCFRCVEPSQIKQILKKMVRNIKFEEITDTNLTIVRTISQILDNVEVEADVLPGLSRKIREEGVGALDVKNGGGEDEDGGVEEMEMEVENQLEDEGDVEMNYLRYDKKMIDIEVNEDPVTASTSSPLLLFLRKHILTSLKSLLFYKLKTSTSSKKDKEEKSRISLTVVITKLLKKLSLKIFLVEFHKIVTKLCRLLKSRDDDSRDNARQCLLQIVRITGPELIYVVVRELKFQLKQDFERHVLNYTIHYILDQLHLTEGTLDYCIPLIIPCAFEEAIGTLSKQKELVDTNQIPIKLFEMKKKKGMLIFKIIGRVISVDKIQFLMGALKQEFNKHGVSEANNEKFNDIIDHILSGLQKNSTLETSSKTLFALFSTVIQLTTIQLTQDSLTQNTLLQPKRRYKTTNKQTYELQSQAAQGKSIFKKLNTQLKLKKNKNQLQYMVYNFWLSLLQTTIKKGIINQQVLKGNKELAGNINRFIVSCVESIDNRIVGKSLKVVESIIRWKGVVNKEKVQGLVVDRFEKLTSGDETLVRVSFKIILVTYQQMKITSPKLSRFFDFIQLYIHDEILQAYQLFRSILTKEPTRKQIPQLFQIIKEKMVSSYDQDIKKISKEIYLTYFTKVMSQQVISLEEGVNYILTNLEYKEESARQILLEVLEGIINYLVVHNRTSFGYFSNIMFFQLVVAYSNEVEEELRGRIKRVQLLICDNVDRSRVKEYINHSICWIKENQESLVFQGLNTLNTLGEKFLSLIQTIDLSSIVKVIQYILKTEADKLNFHLKEEYDIKRREKLKDKLEEWTQILDNTLTAQTVSYCLPVCLELAEKIKILEVENIKEHIWTLCSHTVKEIHLRCLQLSTKVEIIIPDDTYFKNLKYAMEAIVKLDSYPSIPHLTAIISSFKDTPYLQTILTLFRKVTHSFMKRVQKHKQQISILISMLHSLLEPQPLRHILITKHQSILFEILCKFINQKSTLASLDESVNQKIEETEQLVKDTMTAGVFYKIVSDLKKKQRAVRDQNRALKDERKIMDVENPGV